MRQSWYARPVFAVRNAPKALEFYRFKLGFKEDWRSEAEGHVNIVQVSRHGCEVILSDQWPEEVGRGLIFVSLETSDFASLKKELIDHGVGAKSGWWGYDLLIVEDPDGNRLWFPQPGD